MSRVEIIDIFTRVVPLDAEFSENHILKMSTNQVWGK